MSVAHLHTVVGLGATGFSCIRYLQERGVPIAVTDTRADPPQLDAFKQMYPRIPVTLGRLDTKWLNQAEEIVISPGISLSDPAIASCIDRGIPVVGDIELFARVVNKPVIAITGTNAKSTVTTLVGQMISRAGYTVGVGGNVGVPVLDFFSQQLLPDVFVLELSSFQLETTYSLKPRVATILNITPDHLDRYPHFFAYQQAKHRVYQHCEIAVCNRDDPLTDVSMTRKLTFTLDQPGENEFGLWQQEGDTYFAFESKPLLAIKALSMIGWHDQANALAALAIGYAFGLPFAPMLTTLCQFTGLAHRCQFVREYGAVRWYNDSKGTNVGATQAAIEGLGRMMPGKLILIAGGVNKNADFSPLIPALKKYVRQVVLIGEAAAQMNQVFSPHVMSLTVASMAEAVWQANQIAMPGDAVLLSPACASFDMFDHYEHRGEVFMTLVREWRDSVKIK